MVAIDAEVSFAGEPAPEFATGAVLGKRYADDDGGIELLVTKAGAGSLSVGTTALAVKNPKRLPSSD